MENLENLFLVILFFWALKALFLGWCKGFGKPRKKEWWEP